ncbi:AMP-binding protein, partial [Roseibium sp. RKSG952]|uniref:AMP-binding protein n=1 Tax=Roseibium sp. RKSG952 TaxID=2529384 RepID=UPI0012BC53F3
PDQPLHSIDLLDDLERRCVVEGFNATSVEYARELTVLDLFSEQARLRPEAVAVVDGDRKLRYGDVDAASNRLARYLIGLGAGPERVVGICLERSAELIVALLAVFKTGGAYLPLDPDHPEERLSFMLWDAGADLIVTSRVLEAGVPVLAGEGRHCVVLDEPGVAHQISVLRETAVMPAERLAPMSPDNLAYIIYTSGSTG